MFFILLVRDGERESKRGIYSHGGEEIVRVERRRGWLMVNGCACYFFLDDKSKLSHVHKEKILSSDRAHRFCS